MDHPIKSGDDELGDGWSMSLASGALSCTVISRLDLATHTATLTSE
jgi:hypothetical protein